VVTAGSADIQFAGAPGIGDDGNWTSWKRWPLAARLNVALGEKGLAERLVSCTD
jgi:hypothetical protein